MAMKNYYAVKVSYIGKNYSGWQIQPDALSVQEVIETALKKISGANIKITGAGRTDKGVNSVGQIASFGLEKFFEPEKLLLAMNFHLPEDVRILKVYPVDENFNARRNAILREYKYFIYHGSVCPPAFNDFVWWNKKHWDLNSARQAAKLIEGEHDFTAFCRTVECPENPVRTVKRIAVKKINSLTIITIKAQSFITNMVRIIAGNIDRVATGKNDLDWLANLLTGVERSQSAMTAPACGLWFWRAYYSNLKNI